MSSNATTSSTRDTVHRRALAARAKELRDSGLKWREVAEEMGYSRSYVHGLYADPAGIGVVERQKKYEAPCVDCGTVCNPQGLREVVRCAECTHEAMLGRVVSTDKAWTEQDCIEAVRGAAAEYGEPLSIKNLREWTTGREDVPSSATIMWTFDGWAAACRAAGIRNHRDHGGRYRNSLTYEQAVSTLVELAGEMGSVPYYTEYRGYREINGGIPSEPNIRKLIRQRYGDGSWAHIMRDAEQALAA